MGQSVSSIQNLKLNPLSFLKTHQPIQSIDHQYFGQLKILSTEDGQIFMDLPFQSTFQLDKGLIKLVNKYQFQSEFQRLIGFYKSHNNDYIQVVFEYPHEPFIDLYQSDTYWTEQHLIHLIRYLNIFLQLLDKFEIANLFDIRLVYITNSQHYKCINPLLIERMSCINKKNNVKLYLVELIIRIANRQDILVDFQSDVYQILVALDRLKYRYPDLVEYIDQHLVEHKHYDQQPHIQSIKTNPIKINTGQQQQMITMMDLVEMENLNSPSVNSPQMNSKVYLERNSRSNSPIQYNEHQSKYSQQNNRVVNSNSPYRYQKDIYENNELQAIYSRNYNVERMKIQSNSQNKGGKEEISQIYPVKKRSCSQNSQGSQNKYKQIYSPDRVYDRNRVYDNEQILDPSLVVQNTKSTVRQVYGNIQQNVHQFMQDHLHDNSLQTVNDNTRQTVNDNTKQTVNDNTKQTVNDNYNNNYNNNCNHNNDNIGQIDNQQQLQRNENKQMIDENGMLNINLKLNINNQPISQKICISTKDLFKQIRPQLEYKDGSYYKGNIDNQKREGEGTLYNGNHKIVFQGVWQNDRYKEGILFNDEIVDVDDKYDYSDLKNVGQCWVFYQGQFKDGQYNGRGVLKLSNGERYEGEFTNNQINGRGIFYCIDGQVIEAVWNQGCIL